MVLEFDLYLGYDEKYAAYFWFGYGEVVAFV